MTDKELLSDLHLAQCKVLIETRKDKGLSNRLGFLNSTMEMAINRIEAAENELEKNGIVPDYLKDLKM